MDPLRKCSPNELLANLEIVADNGWRQLNDEACQNQACEHEADSDSSIGIPFNILIPTKGKRPQTVLNIEAGCIVCQGKMDLETAYLKIKMWACIRNGSKVIDCSPPSEVTNKVYEFVLSPQKNFKIMLTDNTPECEQED